jgi:hypothetical protein
MCVAPGVAGWLVEVSVDIRAGGDVLAGSAAFVG